MKNIENLVTIKNNEVVCTSLDVAEKFRKRHQEVLYAIEGRKCFCDGKGCNKCNGRGYQQLGILQENLEINAKSHLSKMFKKSNYVDSMNRKRPLYYINRDGFSLLVMGFTGEKALKWKLDYIKAFNKMENIITERKTSDWQETRVAGKTVRLKETDIIKQLAGYAKEQGSEHSDKLYLVYSKLAKTAICNKRDELTITELNTLNMIETMILKTIQADMCLNMGYKQIYQDCKNRLEQFKNIMYLA